MMLLLFVIKYAQGDFHYLDFPDLAAIFDAASRMMSRLPCDIAD